MGKVKAKYIVCDLDGCLIDTKWIWGVVNSQNLSKEEAFDIFNRLANAQKNFVDMTLYKYLCFKASGGLKIHFLTARSEEIETETINFIQRKTGLCYGRDFTISFRPETDLSNSVDSKSIRIQQMLDSEKEIVLAIDDEDSILRMYQSKGIKTLKWIIGFIPIQVASEFGSQIHNLLCQKEEACLN